MLKSIGILVLALFAISIAFIFQQKNSDKNSEGVNKAPFFNLFPQSSESKPASYSQPVPPGPSLAPENFPTTTTDQPQPPNPPAAKPPDSATPPPSAPPPSASIKPIEPKLSLNSGRATSDKIAEEYIILEHRDYENKQKIKISGLRLKNKNNFSVEVGRDENGGDIYLNYGERAVLATGASPKNSNFRVNKCSGYFSQQASFSPSLPYSCPTLASLNLPSYINNRCIDYIESLPSCIMPNINADTQINNDCAAFVSQHASYAGCVSDHSKDADFDQREWRIFFGRSAELWDNRHDNIKLLDEFGKLITEINY